MLLKKHFWKGFFRICIVPPKGKFNFSSSYYHPIFFIPNHLLKVPLPSDPSYPSVCWSVCLTCHKFLKGREVTFWCSYRITCDFSFRCGEIIWRWLLFDHIPRQTWVRFLSVFPTQYHRVYDLTYNLWSSVYLYLYYHMAIWYTGFHCLHCIIHKTAVLISLWG